MKELVYKLKAQAVNEMSISSSVFPQSERASVSAVKQLPGNWIRFQCDLMRNGLVFGIASTGITRDLVLAFRSETFNFPIGIFSSKTRGQINTVRIGSGEYRWGEVGLISYIVYSLRLLLSASMNKAMTADRNVDSNSILLNSICSSVSTKAQQFSA